MGTSINPHERVENDIVVLRDEVNFSWLPEVIPTYRSHVIHKSFLDLILTWTHTDSKQFSFNGHIRCTHVELRRMKWFVWPNPLSTYSYGVYIENIYCGWKRF